MKDDASVSGYPTRLPYPVSDGGFHSEQKPTRLVFKIQEEPDKRVVQHIARSPDDSFKALLAMQHGRLTKVDLDHLKLGSAKHA